MWPSCTVSDAEKLRTQSLQMLKTQWGTGSPQLRVTLEDAASLWDRPQPVWWAIGVAPPYLGAFLFIFRRKGMPPLLWRALLCLRSTKLLSFALCFKCLLPVSPLSGVTKEGVMTLIGCKRRSKGSVWRGILSYSNYLEKLRNSEEWCGLLPCHMDA